jgi:hypothetical protein
MPGPVRTSYRNPPWRYVVTSLETEIITFLDKLATNRQILYTLDEPAVATGDVPADNPEVNIPCQTLDAPPFVHHNSRLLYALRREGRSTPGGGIDHGNVLRLGEETVGTSGAVELDLGAPVSDVYAEFELFFPAGTFADVEAAYTGTPLFLLDNLEIQEADGDPLQQIGAVYDGTWQWYDFSVNAPFGNVEAETWYTVCVRIRHAGGTSYFSTITIDDVDSGYGEIDLSPGTAPQIFRWQGSSNIVGRESTTYFDNMRLGTGGCGTGDLFNTDFESGTLGSIFTGVVEEAEIVGDDPTPAPETTPPWTCRYAGIIMQLEDEGADAPLSRFTAYDPLQHMQNRPATFDDGTLIDEGGYEVNNTRGSDLILQLLANTEIEHGNTFIDFGQTAFFDGTLEDTELLPDGFTIQHGTSVGEAIAQIIDTGTVDIILTPIYDPRNRPGICCELSIHIQAGEVQHEAIFAWDMPSRSLTGITRSLDGTRLANRVQFYAGQGGDPVTLQSDSSSISRYGEYWAQQFFPGKDGPDQDLLVELLALAELQIRKNGARAVALHPASERSPLLFQEYGLGDFLPVYASKNLREPLSPQLNDPPKGYQRVHAIPVEIDDDGIEQLRGILTSTDNQTPGQTPSHGTTPGTGGGDGCYVCDTSGNGNYYWDANATCIPLEFPDNPGGGWLVVSTHQDGRAHIVGVGGSRNGEGEDIFAVDYVDPGC